MELILIIVGLVLGIVITYFACKPKMVITEKENTEIAEQNKLLSDENLKLLIDNREIHRTMAGVKQLVIQQQEEKAKLDGQIDALADSLEDMTAQAEKSAEAIRKSAMEVMQTNLVESAKQMSEAYQSAEEHWKQEYLGALHDTTCYYKEQLDASREELAAANRQVEELRGIVQAAVAANIRDQEKKENTAFYTIGLTEIDTSEIEKLRAVIPYLRNSRPICKAIWEYYYRNLTTDLVNRIVGAGTHTGIYKITCLLDNKIYIGQARDISDRWKTHIKCGLGIDTPSNKLYTAMLKEGVENFSFEVIEECSINDLNKKEKYWIDYYQSNIYGYNMTAGGARS